MQVNDLRFTLAILRREMIDRRPGRKGLTMRRGEDFRPGIASTYCPLEALSMNTKTHTVGDLTSRIIGREVGGVQFFVEQLTALPVLRCLALVDFASVFFAGQMLKPTLDASPKQSAVQLPSRRRSSAAQKTVEVTDVHVVSPNGPKEEEFSTYQTCIGEGRHGS